ncbi:hypothetical protein TRFO_29200 [Tritrichomonas foetus]|uniref:Uncharacterized protein n=1 Tax=Tritrichomonas foetus TaxID=1144522 RepID=A0A1J4K1P4_9EUKA|nr:hypothetical protein TRFO_29200 [Tritrichomonas foetus]|eukprot:OHT03397.1 hypothetical protein TRFO_29200 [Tritrichomonas foetus]
MWYEEENQFVRAPTPKTFDRLVQQLEDNDSVLFESISLPKSNPSSNQPSNLPSIEKNAAVSPPKKNTPTKRSYQSTPRAPQTPDSTNSNEIEELSDDFIDDFDEEPKDEENSAIRDSVDTMKNINHDNEIEESLDELKEKLRKLEIEGDRKLEIIRTKDQQILILQHELAEAQARVNGEGSVPSRSQESVEFYKGRFESALQDLENLKKSLKKDGKIKRVSARSARPITPKI